MDFSVIIPVYNEIHTIHLLLDILKKQTRTPTEILVVDGGSTDGTYEFLQKKEQQQEIRLFQNPIRKGNIARSRNIAIKHAQYDLILCIDAGCKPSQTRCEDFVSAYEQGKCQIACGKNTFLATTSFQKQAAIRLSPTNEPIFAARNLSFYKKIWEKVDGFPEWLTLRGEDTFFRIQVEKCGYEITFLSTAEVQREVRKTFKELYRMYRNYVQGDMEVRIVTGISQSTSLCQVGLFWICGIMGMSLFLIGYFYLRYVWFLLLGGVVFLAYYKKTPQLQRGFNLGFTSVKIAGMLVGSLRGLFTGIHIRRTMRKSLNFSTRKNKISK